MVTICGWKFGASRATVFHSSPPAEYTKLCARCFRRGAWLARTSSGRRCVGS